MSELQHANFGWLHAPPFPPACCHCLILEGNAGLVLIDTGIGTHDIANPTERVGQEAIETAGFQFLPAMTALCQIEQRGFSADDVTDIVLTHCDPDHVGGLTDFPEAFVHLAAEEKQNLDANNSRYQRAQFANRPKWVTYETNDADWFGLPSRCVDTALNDDIRLIPLFGHTHGHCGVAIQTECHWFLHVGDAYYLRGELDDPQHPISKLAEIRADDNARRLESLAKLRTVISQAGEELSYCGYHDVTELPDSIPGFDQITENA
ncbi:MBL fold metallo-hydrolase [Gimesia fumaroli]|uniref:Metallo-beta-lactamase superfamily protein n=1 Tax=Gimesia fumaroli TaxID=2527976 RepID=A0A518I4R2_9PLAN|nr:MBL fold metallo-hydrolase [Gimesia fumaroli]QDV48053.1 Metallo-beta-lactamase superfamily protein [Gimesia fumaroli]